MQVWTVAMATPPELWRSTLIIVVPFFIIKIHSFFFTISFVLFGVYRDGFVDSAATFFFWFFIHLLLASILLDVLFNDVGRGFTLADEELFFVLFSFFIFVVTFSALFASYSSTFLGCIAWKIIERTLKKRGKLKGCLWFLLSLLLLSSREMAASRRSLCRVSFFFTRFSLSFVGFLPFFLPGFTGLYLVLLGLPSFTMFHLVLPSFTGFYYVSPGFT